MVLYVQVLNVLWARNKGKTIKKAYLLMLALLSGGFFFRVSCSAFVALNFKLVGSILYDSVTLAVTQKQEEEEKKIKKN